MLRVDVRLDRQVDVVVIAIRVLLCGAEAGGPRANVVFCTCGSDRYHRYLGPTRGGWSRRKDGSRGGLVSSSGAGPSRAKDPGDVVCARSGGRGEVSRGYERLEEKTREPSAPPIVEGFEIHAGIVKHTHTLVTKLGLIMLKAATRQDSTVLLRLILSLFPHCYINNKK